ncbi:MAG: winged helix-turn-helix transcriptional regulator [Clostridia bacterium]
MDKEVLLMKLLYVAGTIHREHNSREKNQPRLSPMAENTLRLLLKEGRMNQRAIAKKMEVSGQAISELMKKLEEKDYIKRQSGEFNNENIINLTIYGEERAKEAEKTMIELAQKVFVEFSEDEKEDLFFLLEKVENKLGKER